MVTSVRLDPVIEPYRETLSAWTETWRLPDLLNQVRIEFSSRMRTSIGLCYPERSLIRLHPVVRELDEPMFLEVLCHELAHIAVHRLFGRGARPHGREWASLLELSGFSARTRLPQGTIFSTERQRATRKTILWHHRCPGCQAARTARRPVYTWRCVHCRNNGRSGKLEIEREEVVG